MQKINLFDIEGTEFPAGRRTRVLIGANGAIHPERWPLPHGGHTAEPLFCQGYVVIYPGGSVPEHAHPAAESYTILQGAGEMTVQGEVVPVRAGDCVFVPSGQSHTMRNTGTADMHMMFVYAPGVVADHWGQELAGQLA